MRINRLFVAMLLVSASMTAVACGTGGSDMSGTGIEEPADPGSGEQPGGGEPSGGEQPGGGGGVVEPAGGEQPGGGADPGAKPGGGGIVPPSGGEQPGGGGSGTVEFESPADYLNTLVPTQRVDLADIEDASDNAAYTANFDDFVAALGDICPAKTGCTDPVASLLYNTRSSSMKSSGVYPATYPQAKDVLATYEEVVDTAGGGEQPGGDKPAPGGTDMTEVVTDVAEKLNSTPGDGVVWDEISNLVIEVAGGGADGRAASDALLIAMKDASPSMKHFDTIQALVAGEKVAASEAAAALEEIAEAMGG